MSLKIVFLMAACFFAAAFSDTEYLIYEDDGDKGPLSNNCILCMCEVLGCRRDPTCTDSCGPFQITYNYWKHAFNAEENEVEEFRKCTLNAWCATRTVQLYMKRYLPKCILRAPEAERRSVCETAMVLHRFGSSKCNVTNADTKPYTDGIRSCLNRRAWNWLTSDQPTKSNITKRTLTPPY